MFFYPPVDHNITVFVSGGMKYLVRRCRTCDGTILNICGFPFAVSKTYKLAYFDAKCSLVYAFYLTINLKTITVAMVIFLVFRCDSQ